MKFVKEEVVYSHPCSSANNFIFKVTNKEAVQLKEAVDVIKRYKDAIKKIKQAKISARVLKEWKRMGIENIESDAVMHEYKVKGNIVTVKVTEASIG